MMRSLHAASCLAVCAGSAIAQCDWQGVLPPSRNLSSGAWDAAHGRAVVFGGIQFPTLLSADTYLYDGVHWQLVRGPGPTARYGVAMAYDPVRSRVVLFG